MIYPIFASDGSIGKSILTVKPAEEINRQKSISIFSIAEKYDLDRIYLCDDSFCNFIQAHEQAEALNKQLVFGIRFKVCEDAKLQEPESKKNISSIRVWIKESYDFDKGYKDLIKLYSESYKDEHFYFHNRIDWDMLNDLYTDNLVVTIDFYNSFIHRNRFESCTILAKFEKFKPIMEVSNCGLPFDYMLQNSLWKYCKSNKLETIHTHPIYYYNKESIEAYQTFRIVRGRGFGQAFGQPASIQMPQIDHFGSDKFCFEEYCNQSNIEFQKETFGDE